MGCYHPIPAYQEGPDAKLRIWPPLGTANLALPCGTCIGCRSAHATQWGHRCQHEATHYQHNTFLTLTYDDDHLPKHGYLDPRALQLFIKRLRQAIRRNPEEYQRDQTHNLRYLASGEYGERNGRPHYHALLFNLDFTRKQRVRPDLYESDSLRTLWQAGLARFGPADTGAAANYIAQYNLKKQGPGDHDKDGVYRPPPFIRMSTKPPIGIHWLKNFKTDLRHGYLTNDAAKHPIPRAYKKYLARTDPQLLEEIQYNTYKNNQQTTDQHTPDRLRDQEIIHTRMKQLTEHREL